MISYVTQESLENFIFSGQRRIWSFHVVVLQRTAKKCTKNYNAHAQPFFNLVSSKRGPWEQSWLIKPLFTNVPSCPFVVVFFNALLINLEVKLSSALQNSRHDNRAFSKIECVEQV